MHTLITLKLATHKKFSKVHFCKSFDWNPINIYGVMTTFSSKISQRSCHAYKVNHWKELDENWHVDGVTIVGVLFMA